MQLFKDGGCGGSKGACEVFWVRFAVQKCMSASSNSVASAATQEKTHTFTIEFFPRFFFFVETTLTFSHCYISFTMFHHSSAFLLLISVSSLTSVFYSLLSVVCVCVRICMFVCKGQSCPCGSCALRIMKEELTFHSELEVSLGSACLRVCVCVYFATSVSLIAS